LSGNTKFQRQFKKTFRKKSWSLNKHSPKQIKHLGLNIFCLGHA
jgi:hypothetical protein